MEDKNAMPDEAVIEKTEATAPEVEVSTEQIEAAPEVEVSTEQIEAAPEVEVSTEQIEAAPETEICAEQVEENPAPTENTEAFTYNFPTPTASSFSNGAIIDEAEIYDTLQKEENLKKARRAISRNGLNLSAFLLCANIVAFAVSFIVGVIISVSTAIGIRMGGAHVGEQLSAFMEDTRILAIFTALLNIFAMYIVAFPIFCIMQVKFERRKFKKGGLGFGEFLLLIPISQFVMQIGSYIGETLNAIISALFGFNIENSAVDTIVQMPVWLMFLMVCILAPIVEEFMFRRAMIGTLGKYGNVFAIIISSVAFGLFHGNLYQFFYAFMVGLILGYVYVKSGRWWLSVLLHSIMNFLGGVLPTVVDNCAKAYNELSIKFDAGEKVSRLAMAAYRSVNMTYAAFLLVIFVSGMVLTIIAIAKKWYKIENAPEVSLPEKSITKAAFFNVGSIFFLVFTGLTMAASLLVM